jgi:para-aminobenzoate synthetase component 1
MTGAPKVRVMELIEQYETMPRGLFSGTIGYITPEGNADFNVVIRSLFYQTRQQQLEYYVGSGITVYCDPQAEFEECNWKAAAIRRILLSTD